MQARARNMFLRGSPKKMRLAARLVKGKPVEKALDILNYTPKKTAHLLAKTIKSAAANAIASVGTAKLKPEDLMISKIYVDSAPTAKRVRFQSMGRVFRIRKRYCHLTVEVEGEPEPESGKSRKAARKKAARSSAEKGKATAEIKKSEEVKVGETSESADQTDLPQSEPEEGAADQPKELPES
jgi:large subunit ribosomal protein L22